MQIKKHKTIFNNTDKLTFGKYKGKTVGWIISTAPSWIDWALNNVEWFDISTRCRRDLDESLQENDRRQYDNFDEFDSDFQFMDFHGNY